MRFLLILFWLAATEAFAAPFSLPAAQGGEVVFASPPRRIVCLVPEVTDILYAIGAGDQVVGHTHYNTFANEGDAKLVGGFAVPSLAAIEQKQPDCIILSNLHTAVRQEFGGRVPLVRLAPGSIAEILANVTMLGQVTGHEAAAARLVAENRELLDTIQRKNALLAPERRQRVIRFMGRSGDRILVPGDDSFQNDYIRAAGGIPPRFGKSGAMVAVSPEEWRRFDPQVVYGCGDKAKVLAVLAQPEWSGVAAARDGLVYAFPCDLTCRAGTQAGAFVSWLAATIYRVEYGNDAAQVRRDHVVASRPLEIDLGYVRAARVVHSSIRDFEQKTLLVDFTRPMAVLSTLEGMRRNIRTVGNHFFPPPTWGLGHKGGVDSLRKRTCRVLGRAPATSSLLFTGADMDNLSLQETHYRGMRVYALVTAGVKSNAMRMARDSGDFYEPGTINIVLLTNLKLSPQAMTRVIVTASEAKSAALADLDIRSTYTPLIHQATGTGTDNVLVVEGAGIPVAQSGGHTKLGELVARAVYAAVREAVAKQNGITGERSLFARLRERNLSLWNLLPEQPEGCGLARGEVVRRVEEALRDPRYAGFVRASLAVSDAEQAGTMPDLSGYEIWGRTLTAALAGREVGEWRHYFAPGQLPPVVAMAFESLVNGVCAAHGD